MLELDASMAAKIRSNRANRLFGTAVFLIGMFFLAASGGFLLGTFLKPPENVLLRILALVFGVCFLVAGIAVLWNWLMDNAWGYVAFVHECTESQLAEGGKEYRRVPLTRLQISPRGYKIRCAESVERGREYLRLPLGGLFHGWGKFANSMCNWSFRAVSSEDNEIWLLATECLPYDNKTRPTSRTRLEMSFDELAFWRSETKDGPIFTLSSGPRSYLFCLRTRVAALRERIEERQAEVEKKERALEAYFKEIQGLEATKKLCLEDYWALLNATEELIQVLRATKDNRRSKILAEFRHQIMEFYTISAKSPCANLHHKGMAEQFEAELKLVRTGYEVTAQASMASRGD